MLTAFFIILSGGLQDAYTYCCRGKVFANAQTGNIVLLSTHLFEGDWGQALRYLVPVLAFLLGIYIAECVHRHFKRMEKVHWRQLIILAEIVLLAAVGFLPETLNTTANAVVSFVCAMQVHTKDTTALAVVSFVCAMQVQTFRKVRGHAYASTMCIGNMRSGTEALCAYLHTRDKEILHQALTYFGVVLLFALGAGIGSIATLHWGAGTIWLSCGLLTVSFLIMFVHDEEEKLNE